MRLFLGLMSSLLLLPNVALAQTNDLLSDEEAKALIQRLREPITPPWAFERDNAVENTEHKLYDSTLAQPFPDCVYSDCDCSDFKNQAMAQFVFRAFRNDRFQLDDDKDGVACESLPK